TLHRMVKHRFSDRLHAEISRRGKRVSEAIGERCVTGMRSTRVIAIGVEASLNELQIVEEAKEDHPEHKHGGKVEIGSPWTLANAGSLENAKLLLIHAGTAELGSRATIVLRARRRQHHVAKAVAPVALLECVPEGRPLWRAERGP